MIGPRARLPPKIERRQIPPIFRSRALSRTRIWPVITGYERPLMASHAEHSGIKPGQTLNMPGPWGNRGMSFGCRRPIAAIRSLLPA